LFKFNLNKNKVQNMFSKDQILKALTKVIHPEKGKDIVTLGLISEVETGEEGITVTITPEKSNDPFISSVKSSVARTLKEVLGTDAVIKEIIVQPRMKVSGQGDRK
jgi:ATP-binding protein involved in chromosome partitioning